MQIKTLLRTDVPRLDIDAPLSQADLLLRREGLSVLPVVQGRALAGVITDIDLRWASPSSLPGPGRWETTASPAQRRVADIMRVHVPTLAPDAGVGAAARRMAEARLDGLPVVEHDSLLGIVTFHDLLGVLVEEAAHRHTDAFTVILVVPAPADGREAALCAAVTLARRDGGRLVLLHVASEAHRARVGAQVAAGHPGLHVECETASGDWLTAILSAARRRAADLIVTGQPARRGLEGLARRRRLEALIRRAPCPVLAVGGDEGARDARR